MYRAGKGRAHLRLFKTAGVFLVLFSIVLSAFSLTLFAGVDIADAQGQPKVEDVVNMDNLNFFERAGVKFIDFITGTKTGRTLAVPAASPGGLGDAAFDIGTDALGLSNPVAAAERWMGNQLSQIFDNLAEGVSWLFIKGSSWFIGAGGTTMNFATDQLVVKMSNKVKSISGIDLAWEAIRDIANIFFIFVLLYIAISLIIQRNEGDAKKALIRVIIIALLLNFSLFFTKLVIDVANIFTIALNENILASTTTTTTHTLLPIDHGVAGEFMESMGITRAFNPSELGTTAVDKLVKAIIISAFMMAGGLIFFVVAFLLVIRFIALVFLMILSPIAFMGYVLPGLKKSVTDKWLDALVKNAFFAPVLFLAFTISLMIIQTGGMQVGSDAFNNLTIQNTALNFLLVAGFMIGSIFLAQSVGIKGGKGAVAATKLGGKWARSGLASAGMFGVRNTVQRGARAVADSPGIRRMASKSAIARSTMRGLHGVSGMGGKRSLNSKVKAKEEKEKKFMKLLGEATEGEARQYAAQKIGDNGETRLQLRTKKENDAMKEAQRKLRIARDSGDVEKTKKAQKKWEDSMEKLRKARDKEQEKMQKTMYAEQYADQLQNQTLLQKVPGGHWASKKFPKATKVATTAAAAGAATVAATAAAPIVTTAAVAAGATAIASKMVPYLNKKAGKAIQKDLNKDPNAKLADDLKAATSGNS